MIAGEQLLSGLSATGAQAPGFPGLVLAQVRVDGRLRIAG